MKKKLGVAFMSTGIICLAVALAVLVYNNAENKNAQKHTSTVMSSIMTAISENELTSYEDDPFDTQMLTEEIDGYSYIGYLFIPKINLELPVMSECDYTRLKISPCRYYGSTKTDNLVIAAHNYKSQFGYIGNLEPNDYVIFTDMESESRQYIVDSVELLMPTDVDKVKDSGADLILYTCNYAGTMRITVRCSYSEPLS